jgi:hypothetical protein
VDGQCSSKSDPHYSSVGRNVRTLLICATMLLAKNNSTTGSQRYYLACLQAFTSPLSCCCLAMGNSSNITGDCNRVTQWGDENSSVFNGSWSDMVQLGLSNRGAAIGHHNGIGQAGMENDSHTVASRSITHQTGDHHVSTVTSSDQYVVQPSNEGNNIWEHLWGWFQSRWASRAGP